MKKNPSTLWAAFLLLYFAEIGFTGLAVRPVRLRAPERPRWVPNEIVVKFKKGVPENRIELINQRHGTSVLYTSPFAGFKRIKLPAGKAVKQAVELYNREPDVEYAELNYYAYAFFVPDDPYYIFQWHLYETYAGINIEPAWDITTGDPNVIIAVLDTGVAYENFRNFQQAPDLVNTRFVPGYDFVNTDEHPNDEEGHGTHVTGTLAQSTNNNLGTAGIAFNCSIMPVKVLSRRGEAPYTTVADGVYFAADNGQDFLRAILPDCSCAFYVYRNGEGFAINNYHHDSPVGKEWYYILPAVYCDYCGKLELKDKSLHCPACSETACEMCDDQECYCGVPISESKEIVIEGIA